MLLTAPSAPSVPRTELYRVVDHLDAALGVLRQAQHLSPATTMDIYLKSVLTTLRRTVMERVADSGPAGSWPGA